MNLNLFFEFRISCFEFMFLFFGALSLRESDFPSPLFPPRLLDRRFGVGQVDQLLDRLHLFVFQVTQA